MTLMAQYLKEQAELLQSKLNAMGLPKTQQEDELYLSIANVVGTLETLSILWGEAK